MKILVMGAGALGGLLGTRFIEAGEEVFFCEIEPRTREALRQDGISVEEGDGTVTKVKPAGVVASPEDLSHPCDLVLFAVKSYATKVAADALVETRAVGPQTSFLSLQNGLGNAEVLCHAFGSHRVVIGTTSQGATVVAPGRIRHGGSGATLIGAAHPSLVAITQPIVELFHRAHLEIEVREDVAIILWEKLLVNVGINAITALTGILNGAIALCDEARTLAETAVREAAGVAEKVGVRVREDIERYVIQVAGATARNRSSMGQDVDRRRRTEIDAINGVVVRLGERHGIETPINRTLVHLIKTLEYHYTKEADL